MLAAYESDLVGFVGHDLLKSVVRDAQAHLVLHGHHHASAETPWHWDEPGMAHVLSAGSWGLAPERLPHEQPASIRLIILDPAAGTIHAHRLVYNPLARIRGQVRSGTFTQDTTEGNYYHQRLDTRLVGEDVESALQGSPTSRRVAAPPMPAAEQARYDIQRVFVEPASRLLSHWERCERFRLRYREFETRVSHDYAIEVRRVEEWASAGHELHFVVQGCVGDTPMSLEAIGFSADVDDGSRQLACLPAEDSARWKRFLLFPIPPLRESTESVRVRSSYRWPESARALARLHEWDRYATHVPPNSVGETSVVIRLILPSGDDRLYELEEEFNPDTRLIDGSTDSRGAGRLLIEGSYEARVDRVSARQSIRVRVRQVGRPNSMSSTGVLALTPGSK